MLVVCGGGGQLDILLLGGGRLVVAHVKDQLEDAQNCTDGIRDLHGIKIGYHS